MITYSFLYYSKSLIYFCRPLNNLRVNVNNRFCSAQYITPNQI